jgi:hypothetical protein
MKPNLMLHCGATEVARNDLARLIDMPMTTRTYCPIGHDTFVDLVEDKLNDVGFRFGEQAHSLTKEGKRYFGLVQLLNGHADNEQHALVVGIRNSIDKSFPAAVAFGSQVFVCDNLAFSGEVKVSRKHTTNIMRDLPNLVAAAVSNTSLMRENQDARFAAWQDTKLTDLRADRIICNMVRQGVINTSRVEKVINEWDEPTHDFGGRTAWRLFNATTEALKGAPLHDIPMRTIGLQAMLDRAAGFTPQLPSTEGEADVARMMAQPANV